MLAMILKMTGIVVLYLVLSVILWKLKMHKKLNIATKLLIGLIYGMCSVLSTHYAIDYGDMLLNLRDIGPLVAGLFFSPVSGLVAGTIGGVERYVVGTWFGIGSYTRIACSVSTCLAGILAMLLAKYVFRNKKPSPFFSFWIGAVTEVFHMYVVFLTHRSDMQMAFKVVRTCALPMIIFTGIGMAVISIVLKKMSGDLNKIRGRKPEEVPVTYRFQKGLFIVTTVVVIICFSSTFMLQTRSVVQNARNVISDDLALIESRLEVMGVDSSLETIRVGNSGSFVVINKNGTIVLGKGRLTDMREQDWETVRSNAGGDFFDGHFYDTDCMCKVETFGEKPYYILAMLPDNEIYESRDMQAYETVFSYIQVFSVVFLLISYLVHRIVVRNINMINKSLGIITEGNLNEVITVRSSTEFASLSDDINQTVDALKGYIDAAEKRFEQELEYARKIQASALPSNFVFPNRNDFEIYASMEPAKEVGGDFYDFFFIDNYHFALVIADVSGKGIPAALFMMRSKTAIRGQAQSGAAPEEILFVTNNLLCEGNEAEMFVTVWLGIVDLATGTIRCANAGHEFPVLKKSGGDYEYVRDKHSPPLATMEDIRPKGYEMHLEPGDELFVYTDGVPEAINRDDDAYGSERLLTALNRIKDEPLNRIIPSVREDVRLFADGADQFDDITLLGFRYFGQSVKE